MSTVRRLAVGVLIMGVVMGFVYLAGDFGQAPAAIRSASVGPTDRPDDGLEQGSPLLDSGPGDGAVDRASERRSSLRRPGATGPAGPRVFPRPPASLDGKALTPGRWVMPLAPKTYRIGCAWACYVSETGLAHTGQDFPVAVGTPVRSVGAGVVVRSESIYWDQGEKAYCSALPICGRDWTSFGNFVEIRDATEPTLTVWYAHLATRTVTAGATVAAGQVIGTSGDVGNSDGPHLHFEVRRGDKAEDPMPVLRARGAVLQPGPAPTPAATP